MTPVGRDFLGFLAPVIAFFDEPLPDFFHAGAAVDALVAGGTSEDVESKGLN
jgi:hypothetical protein